MSENKHILKENSPIKMREAEVVIINGIDCAFALKYAPGETPKALLKGKGRTARDIIWTAQEMEIPIIEMTSVDDEFFDLIETDEEIPEVLYKPIAQALALLYKTRSTPHRISIIKTLKKRPVALLKKAEELVDRYSSCLEVSLISIELGKDLYEQIEVFRVPLDSLRQKIALEIGMVIPEIRASYNSKFAPHAYCIKMREVTVYEGEVEKTLENPEKIKQIVNRLRLLINKQAWQLLGYTEVEALLERLKIYNKNLYKELFPGYFSVPALRFVLRNLLKEGISIRDLTKILEIIKDNLHITSDPDLLTEFVRTGFAAYLCNKYKSKDGYLEVLLLDMEIEKIITGSIKESSQVRWLDINPEDGYRLLTSLSEELKKAESVGLNPVILCSPGIRRFLKRFLETSFPHILVLSYNEIVPFAEVRSVGIIK